MTFSLNLETAVDGIIDFDIPSNVKLHIRATTKLENKLYNFVPHDLLNFLEFLNNQATEFQWSDNVEIMMILKGVSDANTDYVKLLTNNCKINLNLIKKLKRHKSESNREQHKIKICCIIA